MEERYSVIYFQFIQLFHELVIQNWRIYWDVLPFLSLDDLIEIHAHDLFSKLAHVGINDSAQFVAVTYKF